MASIITKGSDKLIVLQSTCIKVHIPNFRFYSVHCFCCCCCLFVSLQVDGPINREKGGGGGEL